MAVVFNTFESIEIDGTLAGNIVDVISNHAPKRREVLAAFGVFTEGLRTALESEKTQLVFDHTTAIGAIQSQLDSANATITQLQTKVAYQKENLLNDKTNLLNDKVALQAQVLSLTATIDRLTVEIASLQPWNRRWIDPEKFVDRFTPKQARAFYTSTDATLIGAKQLLETYIDENYHIDLDDEQSTGLTAYMVSVDPPILTAEERQNVLRDSDSSERYVPNKL
jgi:hypothetical protein